MTETEPLAPFHEFIGDSAPGTYILHTVPHTQPAGRAAGGALGGAAYGAAAAARARARRSCVHPEGEALGEAPNLAPGD